MRLGQLERELYPPAYVGKPNSLHTHSTPIHRFHKPGGFLQYPTSLSQCGVFIPTPMQAIRPIKQQSEPLDLSKPNVSKLSSPADSKLEQILTSSSTTSTNCRKRPYSCLTTDSRNTVSSKYQHGPRASVTNHQQIPVANHQWIPVTSHQRIPVANHQQKPVTISMEEAADNPVVMVELAPGSEIDTSERISCSLIKMMSKVFSISQFTRLSEDDKVALLHNSWHRLMLWCLASDKFTFKVSTMSLQSASTSTGTSSLRCPSMAFVKGISVFIKKFAALSISAEEFSLLFGITLFHAGKPSLASHIIDHIRKDLMKQLQLLVQSTGSDTNRHTELLLCLPFLYSIDEDMFESLFCSKKFCNGDIKILLKDAVKQVTKNISSL